MKIEDSGRRKFNKTIASPYPGFSAQFTQWFSKSQVVDHKGQPLKVFHGTQYDVPFFSDAMQGDTVYSGDIGFFFTNDIVEANAYATWDWDRESPQPNIMPVYLSIQRPLLVNISNPFHLADAPGLWYDKYGQNMADYALNCGYDGLIISDFECADREPVSPYSGKQTLYIAFRPEQIKSAIGNSGAFDLNNKDLCT